MNRGGLAAATVVLSAWLSACAVDTVRFTPLEAARCGNGVVDMDEACDDGNDIAGDGCELDCTIGACAEPPCEGPRLVSFAPTADAAIRVAATGGDATTNYGTDRTLLTYGSSFGTKARSLLAFDPSSVAPGTVIRSAHLVLRLFDQAGNALSIQVHDVLQPWSETAVTWTTQPPIGPMEAVLPFQPRVVWRFDITALVQRWIDNPGARHGLMLVQDPEVMASGGQLVRFHAREGAVAPAIEIVLDP